MIAKDSVNINNPDLVGIVFLNDFLYNQTIL